MKLFLLGAIVGGLIGLALTDLSEVMQADESVEPSMTLPQGSCDPAKTQVLRMDGAEQITQVLDRGVNCVVVMQ